LLKEKDENKKQKKLADLNTKKLKIKEMQGAEDGNVYSNTIIIPEYKWNSEMNQYEPGPPPSDLLYHRVGFNDLQIINEIMDGDDNAKRNKKTMKAKTTKKSQSRLSRLDDDEHLNTEEAEEKDQADKENLEMRTLKTKEHFRKYYEDELENNKELLGTTPFVTYDLKRGASRGNSSSFFGSLFSSDKVDEEGEVTTEKTVGHFKGRIDVYNIEERTRTTEEK
jgi:hypothetical protein